MHILYACNTISLTHTYTSINVDQVHNQNNYENRRSIPDNDNDQVTLNTKILLFPIILYHFMFE